MDLGLPVEGSHLVVELKLLHVHTQELGVYRKPSCLISRSDVKDDVPEAVRKRSQHGTPLFRALSPLPQPLLGAVVGATDSPGFLRPIAGGLFSIVSQFDFCLFNLFSLAWPYQAGLISRKRSQHSYQSYNMSAALPSA